MSDDRVGRYSVIGKSGQPRFSAALLGAELTKDYPPARNSGAWLYAYHEDKWQPKAEELYRFEIRQRMGEMWLPGHASAALQWIIDGATHLNDQPPLDRIRVSNGILKPKDDGWECEDHSVEPYTPVAIPIEYDPDARCPKFDRFMRQALTPPVRVTAQEIMGYILVPDNAQQKAVLAVGSGGNGKSVWLRVCRELVGPENCSTRSLQALADDRFAPADLYGKLVNIYADLSSNELSSSSLFRAITGGDAISAEQKNKNPFSFVPFARLLFSANNYPAVANPINALFDRWVILPFNRRFRNTKRENKQLMLELIQPEELSGVLNYALAGLVRLRQQGQFTISVASQRSLDRFRIQADNVAVFLQDFGKTKRGAFVQRNELWEHYRMWNERTGHTKVNRNKFYERIEALRGGAVKRDGYYGWKL